MATKSTRGHSEHLDGRAFGRIEEAVDNLTAALDLNAAAIKDLGKEFKDFSVKLSHRMTAIEDKYRFGKVAVVSALFGAGFAGFGLKEFLEMIFKAAAGAP